MAGLKKIPGNSGEGWYTVSGSLEEVTGPGRRTVEILEVHRATDLDLSVLSAFPDLRRLELERVARVRIETLPRLPGLDLGLELISHTDLAGLSGRDDLRRLAIVDASECHVPPRMTLPDQLESLWLTANIDRSTGEPIKAMLEAIDWSQLSGLRDLNVRVSSGPLVQVDLGFLRLLPNLERLEVRDGIEHVGPQPSPLEPPFSGLSKRLTWVRIDAWDPPRVQAAMQSYLGLSVDPMTRPPTVYQRYGWEPDLPAWSVFETAGGWGVYGSFYEVFDGAVGDTEDDALREVKRRVRAVDRSLLKRLEFDQEAAGTGVWALDRVDIERLLEIVGVTPPATDPHGDAA